MAPMSSRISARAIEAGQDLGGVRTPTVIHAVQLEELGKVLAHAVVLSEPVLGHRRVVEGHVMVRPVIDDELHDRARRRVVARISYRVTHFEDDARSCGSVTPRQPVDRRARILDAAGQRVAAAA